MAKIIPTETLWNKDGERAIINAGDAEQLKQFRELGYELEEVIRKDMPEELKQLPMEEAIKVLSGEADFPKKEENPPADEGKKEDPPDSTPEGEAAQDQAVGEIQTRERPSRATKTSKRK